MYSKYIRPNIIMKTRVFCILVVTIDQTIQMLVNLKKKKDFNLKTMYPSNNGHIFSQYFRQSTVVNLVSPIARLIDKIQIKSTANDVG